MDAVEKAIRSALENGDADERSFRESVYRKAFAALERAIETNPGITPEVAERRRASVQAKIAEIESEFIPALPAIEPAPRAPAEPMYRAPFEPSPRAAPPVPAAGAHEPRSDGARAWADPRPADPRPADPRPADPRPADPRPAEPRLSEPRSAEPRPAEPRAEPRQPPAPPVAPPAPPRVEAPPARTPPPVAAPPVAAPSRQDAGGRIEPSFGRPAPDPAPVPRDRWSVDPAIEAPAPARPPVPAEPTAPVPAAMPAEEAALPPAVAPVAAPASGADSTPGMMPTVEADPNGPVPRSFFPDLDDFGPPGTKPSIGPEAEAAVITAAGGPNVRRERRRPFAAMFLAATLVGAVGIGIWWAVSTGLFRLPGDDGSVPNPPIAGEEDFIPEDENNAPQMPGEADAERAWVTVFSPADPTVVNAPAGTSAEVIEDDSGEFIRIRSGGSGSWVLFDVGQGVLEQLAGKVATFDIVARSEEGAETQFAVECNFGDLGDCGRKRYAAVPSKGDFLFEVTMPAGRPGAAGTIGINTDITNAGKALDVYEIRVSTSQ